jgi:hypothetical protein
MSEKKKFRFSLNNKTSLLSQGGGLIMDNLINSDLELGKEELMDKYSIFFENEKYVYGPNTFDSLDEAIKHANAFIDEMVNRFSPNAYRVSA